MANTIKIRRSATAAAVPTTTQLALGELAVNTTDGKLFLKKDVSGTESIVEVGALTAGSIVDSNISATAEIAVSKLADGAAHQLLQTDAAGTGVEWTNNVDIPGTLDVTSTAKFDSTISFPLGTAALPSIFPGTDTNTGIYSPGADQVAVSTGGVQRLFVNSTGILGLGAAATSAKYANGHFYEGAAENRLLTISSTSTNLTNGQARFSFVRDAAVTAHDIGEIGGYWWDGSALNQSSEIAFFADGAQSTGNSPGAIIFRTTPSGSSTVSERLRITSTGNVGIGTSTPSAKLTTQGISGTYPTTEIKHSALETEGEILRIGRTDSAVRYHSITAQQSATAGGADNYLAFKIHNTVSTTAQTEVLRLTGNGRVGIGTTSPVGALDVNVGGTGPARIVLSQASDNPHIDFYRTDGISVFSGFRISNPSATTGALTFSTAANAAIGSHTFTERARIDSSGRLLVGTSSAIANASATQAGEQLHGTGAEFSTKALFRWSNDNGRPVISFSKSRGASVGTRGVVQSDDLLAVLSFEGDDGTNFIRAANITATVDGTPGANDMPGRLVFSTTADGASTPTERLRIDSTGQIEAGSLGTAAAPVWSFLNDPNTGIYSPGADQLAIATNGTVAGLFDSSGNLRLYNTAGTFYHNFSGEPTANRTITLPDANVTLVGGTMVASGGALGTPSSGTLTNCTFPILNQSTTGNAATATNLSSNRTFALTGDVTGSVSSNLSSGASIAATVVDNSHNHSTSTLSDVTDGSYTPTAGTFTNLDSVTISSSSFFYMRVGNKVMVNGRAVVDATTAADWAFRLSLPITAGAFADTSGAHGTGNVRDATEGSAVIQALTGSTTQVTVLGHAGVTSATTVFLTFMYDL